MLKKLIRESFFNPLVHFLPLFVFLIVEETGSTGRAWVYSLPVLILAGGYIRLMYSSLVQWYVVSAAFFVVIALLSTILSLIFPDSSLKPVFTELVMLGLLFVLYLERKLLQRWLTSISSRKFSMMNNLSEMVRFTEILMIFTAVFMTLYLFVSLRAYPRQTETYRFLEQLYVLSLILFSAYQTVRVFAVRNKLMKEEWWPIVNHNGKEIGSIHYESSLWLERQKFMHPVVRIIVMEGTRILLHQNTFESDNGVQQWDSALNSHVKYGETVTECIGRVGMDFYGCSQLNPAFLTNYTIENSCEYQYVHLFVSGRIHIERINPGHSLRLKWWTLNQICEELNSGIFTDNFIREFELLMRSGLIDSGSCTCECNLRDVVHQKKTLA